MAPRLSPAATLEKALAERRVLVTCGSGGVGKTTTAAALAVRAALRGRRVLVCTIDPSRRLATSLGKGQLSGRPRAIELKGLSPARGGGGAAGRHQAFSSASASVPSSARPSVSRKRKGSETSGLPRLRFRRSR